MKILVANHHMKQLGGSETFTYTLIGELVHTGHNVDLFTFHPGMISDKVEEDFGVRINQVCIPYNFYDLVLASHNTTIKYIYDSVNYDFLIQTCHGIYPSLEQPSSHADKYVSISKEVHDYLFKSCGYESYVIWNGIDCKRFNPINPIRKKLKNILSLAQFDKANEKLTEASQILGVNFTIRNKFNNPIWNIEDEINKADLVVSLGRGAYEAMACGRAVLIYDSRNYSKDYTDGMITPYNAAKVMENNCSGRSFRLSPSVDELVDEIKKYHFWFGDYLHTFALFNLNIKYQVKKYLNIYNKYYETNNK